jgi:hypothetical protein
MPAMSFETMQGVRWQGRGAVAIPAMSFSKQVKEPFFNDLLSVSTLLLRSVFFFDGGLGRSLFSFQ